MIKWIICNLVHHKVKTVILLYKTTQQKMVNMRDDTPLTSKTDTQ
jgi:hypothetical protein